MRSVNVMGRSDVLRRQCYYISQVYTILSCPHKNVYIVQLYQTRRMGVHRGRMVIGSLANNCSDAQIYNLIPKTVNWNP